MTSIGLARPPSLLASLGLVVSVWPRRSAARSAISVPASTPELETVLGEGRELETQRRWGEAVTLYEEASRRNPGQPALEERLDLAKIHYDIGRRYADARIARA